MIGPSPNPKTPVSPSRQRASSNPKGQAGDTQHHTAAMPPVIPYTYIQCPCSDNSPPDQQTPQTPTSASAEHTFDPHDPRSNYSLYPLEYLLYCEDCQQIRCPRCVNEEIVTYYCPNCLFEVPSSNLRSEGNR